MTNPEDTKVAEDITIAWNVCDDVPPTDQFMWLRQVLDLGSFPKTFNHGSRTCWMPLLDGVPGRLHHLGLFAGGFGGWTVGCNATW